MKGRHRFLVSSAAFVAVGLGIAIAAAPPPARRSLREVNEVAAPAANKVIAIIGATLVDGRGGTPVADAVVVVRGSRIVAAGTRAAVAVPLGAEAVDASGQWLVPGLIDSHFHLDGDATLPQLFLTHGVTSVRDPGQWIEAYDGVRKSGAEIPRLFLAGPHLDTAPPAYPDDSYIARDPEETRQAVQRAVASGASSIKVYFRLPLASIQAAVAAAHARGIPVTAHLEIVDAADALRAGVDGIEHVTSFGTALLPPREAEKYRQAVLADNNARREGRYEMWSRLKFDTPRAAELFKLIGRRQTFVSATLAVFERRTGDRNTTAVHVEGFHNMKAFVGRAASAGGRVVVGSHSGVPHAERGWAYQREMELLVDSGLSPLEAITAATLQNARFFRIEERLGTIEAGKLADLVLLGADPVKDIAAMRQIRRVMLNGRWVDSK
ncbi:MAG: amidohydrolase family protein [Acidobacteriota bacterium]